jgi:hypothetical protein
VKKICWGNDDMEKPFFMQQLFGCAIILLLICISAISSAGKQISSHNINKYEPQLFPPEGNATVPDCAEIGDLFLIDFWVDQSNLWKRPGLYNEHGAIYIGNNTLIEANGMVRYRNYSLFHNYAKNLVILRVKSANESQRYAAVAWAESKIGLPYQVFFDFPWFGLKIADTNRSFPTANELYCMELIWAAYYNQGIDIDRNGWKFPIWVNGNDIIYDDDIEIIYQEVNDSTEIVQPYKGVYFGDRKIVYSPYFTMVFGAIDIEVNTSNDKVTSVDFYIDNVYKATDTSPPFTWRWDERGSGEKTITAVARDESNHEYFARLTVHKYI